MRLNVLNEFSVDGVAITAPQEQLVLLGLLAAGRRRMSVADLEMIVRPDATPNQSVIPPLVARINKTSTTPLIDSKRWSGYSLAIDADASDIGRFFSDCAAFARGRVSPQEMIERADELLARCPAGLWPGLVGDSARATSSVDDLRRTVLEHRRLVLVLRAYACLLAGQVSDMAIAEFRRSMSTDAGRDFRVDLAYIQSLWAQGRVAEAVAAVKETRSLGAKSRNRVLEQIGAEIELGGRWNSSYLPPYYPGAPGDSSYRLDTFPRLRSRVRRPDRGWVWRGALYKPIEAVGHADSAYQIQRMIELSASKSTNVCLVQGARGVGKSLFIQSIANALERSAVDFYVAPIRCGASYQASLGTFKMMMEPLMGRVSGAMQAINALGDAPEAIAEAGMTLLSVCSAAPTVFLIDDAHHCDVSTLSAMGVALANRTPKHPLWFVLTVDSQVVDAVTDEAPFLSTIRESHNTRSIQLDPLTQPEVAALSMEILSRPLDLEDVECVCSATEGYPARIVRLFEYLHMRGKILSDSGCLFFEEDSVLGWPESGHSNRAPDVRRWFSDDAPESRHLLIALATLNPESRVDDVIAISGCDRDWLRTQLKVLGGTIELDPGSRSERIATGEELASLVNSFRRDFIHDSDRAIAVGKLLVRSGGEEQIDPEREALIGRLCSEIGDNKIDQFQLDAGRLVPILKRTAEDLESRSSWIAAARIRDCLCVIGPGIDERQNLYLAGRAWMRGHDFRRARWRLDQAADETFGQITPIVAESLALAILHGDEDREGGRAIALKQLVDRFVREQPECEETRSVLLGIWAESAAIVAEHKTASERLEMATRLEITPTSDAANSGAVASLQFSTGVVELLAGRPISAIEAFSRSAANAATDRWMACAAQTRVLLCRSIADRQNVTAAEIDYVKSLAFSVQSWPGLLVASVAAALGALREGDMLTAQAETRQAVTAQARASHSVVDRAIRLLVVRTGVKAIAISSDANGSDLDLAWSMHIQSNLGSVARDNADLIGLCSGAFQPILRGEIDLSSCTDAAIAAELVAGGLPSLHGDARAAVQALQARGFRTALGTGLEFHSILATLGDPSE